MRHSSARKASHEFAVQLERGGLATEEFARAIAAPHAQHDDAARLAPKREAPLFVSQHPSVTARLDSPVRVRLRAEAQHLLDVRRERNAARGQKRELLGGGRVEADVVVGEWI